jgi:polar amino acid transport system permease protein
MTDAPARSDGPPPLNHPPVDQTAGSNGPAPVAPRRQLSRRRQLQLVRWGVYGAAALLFVVLGSNVDWPSLGQALFDPDIARDVFPAMITTGIENTVAYTLIGFTLGLFLGVVLAVMRLSRATPFRWFAATYIEIFRGIPLLVTLLILGFGIPIATGWQWPSERPASYLQGAVPLALVAGAYIAETVRAGIEAVPTGQMEAARSLGMRYSRAMVSVVIPQAFRIVVPPLTNELVLLVKDTSLISVLGVTAATKDLTRIGRDGVNSFANATPLVVAGLLYLALTVPLTRLAAYLERRGKRGRR